MKCACFLMVYPSKTGEKEREWEVSEEMLGQKSLKDSPE